MDSPTQRPLPEPGEPRASFRMLAALAAYGLAFDLAFNGQRPGLSFPLFVAALAFGLRAVAPRERATDALLGAAVALSIFPALRAAEGLTAVNVIAVATLLALGVVRPERIAETSTAALARAALVFGRGATRVVWYVTAPFAAPVRRLGVARWRPGLRAAAIALPLLGFFALLLSSADPVFADILIPSLPEWGFVSFASHVALTIAGALAVAILWRAAAAGTRVPEAESAPRPDRFRLRFVEWAAALAGLDALFALFVLVQFAFLFGGAHRVEVTEGLTYAEYARSGFAQLIVTGGLVGGVVLAMWDFGVRVTPREERVFRWLAAIMVGLCAVILASALQRLALYQSAFGFTARRFAGYAIILFLALTLAVLAWALLTGRRRRVLPGVLAAALAVVFVVNLMNPVRFIAEQNAHRFAATGKVDAAYLATLGPDATPVVAPLARKLDGDAALVAASLCSLRDSLGSPRGWRSWNAARAAARKALDGLACRRLRPG